MNTTYTCSRCSGSGRLDVYSNVLGGVCFKCKGSGQQTEKPRAKAVRWAVMGSDRENGAAARLYNIDAPTAAKAIAKARATYERASTAFRDQYSLANATAVPAAEIDALAA